jgi:hypothetical protein
LSVQKPTLCYFTELGSPALLFPSLGTVKRRMLEVDTNLPADE